MEQEGQKGQGAFTPGPWEAARRLGRTNRVISTDGKANDGFLIASAHGPDQEANAHLMAASPTMFEFIERKAAEGDVEARGIVEAIHASR